MESPMEGTSMVTLPLAAESHRRAPWKATLPRIAEKAATFAGCARAPAAATRAGSACRDQARREQANAGQERVALGARADGGLAVPGCGAPGPGRGSHARNSRNAASVSVRLKPGNRRRARPRPTSGFRAFAGRRVSREERALRAAQRRTTGRCFGLAHAAASPPPASTSRTPTAGRSASRCGDSPQPRERRCERTGRAWLVSARWRLQRGRRRRAGDRQSGRLLLLTVRRVACWPPRRSEPQGPAPAPPRTFAPRASAGPTPGPDEPQTPAGTGRLAADTADGCARVRASDSPSQAAQAPLQPVVRQTRPLVPYPSMHAAGLPVGESLRPRHAVATCTVLRHEVAVWPACQAATPRIQLQRPALAFATVRLHGERWGGDGEQKLLPPKLPQFARAVLLVVAAFATRRSTESGTAVVSSCWLEANQLHGGGSWGGGRAGRPSLRLAAAAHVRPFRRLRRPQAGVVQPSAPAAACPSHPGPVRAPVALLLDFRTPASFARDLEGLGVAQGGPRRFAGVTRCSGQLSCALGLLGRSSSDLRAKLTRPVVGRCTRESSAPRWAMAAWGSPHRR